MCREIAELLSRASTAGPIRQVHIDAKTTAQLPAPGVVAATRQNALRKRLMNKSSGSAASSPLCSTEDHQSKNRRAKSRLPRNDVAISIRQPSTTALVRRPRRWVGGTPRWSWCKAYNSDSQVGLAGVAWSGEHGQRAHGDVGVPDRTEIGDFDPIVAFVAHGGTGAAHREIRRVQPAGTARTARVID